MSTVKIAVTGGGRIGHLYAALLKQTPNTEVRFYSRKADQIRNGMPETGIKVEMHDGTEFSGRPDLVSSDIAEVVTGADLILITQTANGRPQLLEQIAKHVDTTKPVLIGGIPGCGCFDWLAESYLSSFANVGIFGFLDVPHTVARIEPGSLTVVGGVKSKAYIGFHENTPSQLRERALGLIQTLLPMPVESLNHFMEVTLIPLGFMHPTVLYANFGPYSQWDGKPIEKSFRWFTDLSELGSYFIQRCDEEQQLLVRAVEKRLNVELPRAEPLKTNLVSAYGDQIGDHRTLYTVLKTNAAYRSFLPMIPAEDGPGLRFKPDHPILIEDTFYGLAYLVEMGKRLNVPMPYMNEIYDWTVEFLGGPQPSTVDYMPVHWPASENATAA